MAKGEIELNEELCKGCGYCIDFCTKNCLEMSDKLGPKGIVIPSITLPDECNGCGVCAWMCPDFAIEVYRYVD